MHELRDGRQLVGLQDQGLDRRVLVRELEYDECGELLVREAEAREATFFTIPFQDSCPKSLSRIPKGVTVPVPW